MGSARGAEQDDLAKQTDVTLQLIYYGRIAHGINGAVESFVTGPDADQLFFHLIDGHQS